MSADQHPSQTGLEAESLLRAPPQRSALPLTQAFLEMSLDVNIGREVTSPGAFVLTLQAALPGPHSLLAEPWLASCPSQSREGCRCPPEGPGGPGGVAGSLSLLVRRLASVAWQMSRSETSAQIRTPIRCPQRHFGCRAVGHKGQQQSL